MRKKFACLTRIVCFAATVAMIVAAHAAGFPEKLRVLSIDLGNARIEPPGTPGSEVAQELRHVLETADVDIVCLQGVTDWESCERICKLKPGLNVITCSAFTGKTPNAPNAPAPQVAILACDRAVLSWVEEMPDSGGFALAIVQAGSRKFAVFSVQSGKSSAASPGATSRVLAEVKKLQNFPQNRPECFLIAGTGLAASALTDGLFQNVPPEPQPNVKASEFWIANGGFLTRPRMLAVAGLHAPLAVCDFDTASSFSSKFAYHTPLLFAGESPAPVQAAAQPASGLSPIALLSIVSTAFILMFAALVFFRKSHRSMALQLASMDVTDGHPPRLNQAERSNLVAWFKSLFVQRLLSDRQQLLSNEDEATRRTLAIEQKLSNMQETLQSRISAYEARIERLELELTAATFENRDLIRSQIEMLKEKVAKAREEQLTRRN